MNIRRELIALAVRVLASDDIKSIRKPEPFEEFVAVLFSGETYDERIARNIDEDIDRAVRTAKNIRRNREFKKIAERY